MPSQNVPVSNYDPRWFIWTIVFLVVTGVSLVGFMVLSDSGTNDVSASAPVVTHKDLSVVHK